MPEAEHYLTEKRREYLKTPPDERAQKYDKNTITQYNFIIERFAQQALKDLILVSLAYPKKKNEKIFTTNIVKSLLYSVVLKQGDVETEDGIFFHEMIKAIEVAMNEGDEYPYKIKCNIVEIPQSSTPIGGGKFEKMSKDQKERYLKRMYSA